MKLLRISACASVLTLLILSCATPNIERAFDGEFEATKNNRLIYEYCGSCHVHRNLIPSSHVAEKVSLYKSKKFTETRECRTCHYITKNLFDEDERKTIRPGKRKRKKS